MPGIPVGGHASTRGVAEPLPDSLTFAGRVGAFAMAAERDRTRTRGNVCADSVVTRGVTPDQRRYLMADLPPPPEGIVLTHFIVSDDVERSRRFYTEVLGGRVAFPGDPVNVALANSWIVINTGGGPTDDKPTVILETPRDPDRVSSFLNIRVKDIDAVYAEWSARGAQFLTPPKQHQYEKRCYIRDPDGHLIEVGQTTDPDGDWSPAHWPSSTHAE
jgi:catechol 2,3-dioxygenase-like lactoylglutathione lyase family enzyme